MSLALFVWTIRDLVSLIIVVGFVLGMLVLGACEAAKGVWRRMVGDRRGEDRP
jgi:hypothetical protein